MENIMKSYISAALIFAVLLVTVPAAPLLTSELKRAQAQEILQDSAGTEKDDPNETDSENEKAENNQKEKQSSDSEDSKEEKYKVLDITTGKVEEISAFDYIVGAVCAEMPATFETEALKALAVGAHTYAQRKK